MSLTHRQKLEKDIEEAQYGIMQKLVVSPEEYTLIKLLYKRGFKVKDEQVPNIKDMHILTLEPHSDSPPEFIPKFIKHIIVKTGKSYELT